MKIALSAWKENVSIVFDTAEELLILEQREGNIFHWSIARFLSLEASARAKQLKTMGIDVLICGAISRPVEAVISAAGITVVSFVRGPAKEVLKAYITGQLQSGAFALPGCKRYYMQKWRCLWSFTGTPIIAEETDMMNNLNLSGCGKVSNRVGRRRGRLGGPKAAGPIGYCVCPNCGYQKPHERGLPCWQKLCPNCGIPMKRE